MRCFSAKVKDNGGQIVAANIEGHRQGEGAPTGKQKDAGINALK